MEFGRLWLRWGLSLVYAALTGWAMLFYGFDLMRTPIGQVGVLYVLLGGLSMLSIGFGFRRLRAPRADSWNGPGLGVLGYFLFPAAYSAPGLAVLSELMHQLTGDGPISPWVLPVLVHVLILSPSGLLLWVDS